MTVPKPTKIETPAHEQFVEMLATADKPVMVTQGSSIVFANELFESLLEIPAHVLYEMHGRDCYHPEELPMLAKRRQEFYEGKMLFPAFQTRMVTGSDKVLPVEIISTPCFWEDKPALLSFLTDLGKEKQLEREVLAMQRLKSVGTLAGGIAHDFNNILTIIQGSVSMALDETSPSDPRFTDLKAIEAQVQSGAWLTQQILGYARRNSHTKDTFDLVDLVQSSIDTFARTQRHIRVHYNAYVTSCWVNADARAIEHALLNLYINAADAMPKGGDLMVKIDKVEGKSIMHCDNPDELFARITVKDSGVGIEDDMIDRIFEPFFTTKAPGRGTGLGLSSVYGVVKAHNGYIDVASTRGEGSVFEVCVPISSPPEVEVTETVDQADVSACKRLLIVDDEVPLLRLAQRALSKRGYEVLTASSGTEAVELYRERWQQIDLVVLDIIMPGMGGEETFSFLKEINPEVRIVFASGYAREEQELKVKELGYAGFLPKPYTYDDLVEKLGQVFDNEPSTDAKSTGED